MTGFVLCDEPHRAEDKWFDFNNNKIKIDINEKQK
jgi:hypothetical protein